jgi:hypothetical protein
MYLGSCRKILKTKQIDPALSASFLTFYIESVKYRKQRTCRDPLQVQAFSRPPIAYIERCR